MPALIAATLTPPTDVMAAIDDQLGRVPRLMGTSFRRGMKGVANRYLGQLRVEPGAPPEGITRLMTPRQRRAFFATNGFGGGIPHERTHGIANGWQYSLDAADAGGEFTIYNDVPGINYVEGDDQQHFLAAMGWLYAPPILMDARAEAEDVAIEIWYTVSDPFGGAQG